MAAQRTRVTFHKPPDLADVAANLWVDLTPTPGAAEVRLIYLYPDFFPAIGWEIELPDGTRYEVNGVSEGVVLHCVEVPK